MLSATKPRNGYFLRAESFFNVAQFIDSGDRFAPDLSLYGDVPLHEQSHGESFLRWPPTGSGLTVLYLLDEPEAALSVTGALALLVDRRRAPPSGRAVRHRHPLADPARRTGRPDLRAERGRHQHPITTICKPYG